MIHFPKVSPFGIANRNAQSFGSAGDMAPLEWKTTISNGEKIKRDSTPSSENSKLEKHLGVPWLVKTLIWHSRCCYSLQQR
jgi:hypothetical protein